MHVKDKIKPLIRRIPKAGLTDPGKASQLFDFFKVLYAFIRSLSRSFKVMHTFTCKWHVETMLETLAGPQRGISVKTQDFGANSCHFLWVTTLFEKKLLVASKT